MTRRSTTGRAAPLGAALLWLLFAPAAPVAAADATPQIFKCTDGAGNVTYQNEPCPKNAKAGRIEIFDNRWSATKEEREAEWRRNASDHKIVTGMPARWVRDALGEPTEIRDTPTAGAAHLWLYSLPDRSVQVGMLNDQVLWYREAPVTTPPVAAAPADRPQAQGSDRPPPPAIDQPAAPATSRPAAPAIDRPVAQAATPSSPRPATAAPSRDLPVTRLSPSAGDRVASEPRASVEPRTASPPADANPPFADASAPQSGASAPQVPAPAPQPAGPAAQSQAGQVAAAKSGPARGVARGQDCRQALADLGPPTRQRDVPALDAGSDPATEYFYESSDAPRLRIVCSNGKVEGVDRSVTR